MKISFHRGSMLSACRLASQATSKAKPILRNLLLQCGPESTLMATDGEIGVRVALRAIQCDSEGSVLLSPTFIQALAESTDETMHLSGDEKRLTLKGERSKFAFPVEGTEGFSIPPEMPEGDYAEVTGNDFDALVEKTGFAADMTNAKFGVTKGVRIESGPVLSFVALNAHRLSKFTVTPYKEAIFHGIVPIPPLRMAKAAQDGGRIKIAVTEQLAFFGSGDAVISTPLIAGKFPPYEKLLNGEATFKIEFPAGPICKALRQASIMTSEETNRLNLTFADGKLNIESTAADVGESSIDVPMEMNGTTFKIAYQPHILMDMLSRLGPDDKVMFSATHHEKPATMRHGEWVYMATPMFERAT